MKWKQMLFTIVLNIFLMLILSVAMEYSDLTDRFVSIENSVQESLDMAISASVHSEEFFTAQYQSKLMSYASIGDTNDDATVAATTLVWLQEDGVFAQVNTYQFAEWYSLWDRLPANSGDINDITSIGVNDRYGLSGHVFEWLYGGAGSDYNNAALAYANRNSARQFEYAAEGSKANGNNRRFGNLDFMDFYFSVGSQQETSGYLKEQYGDDSYRLALQEYPVLCNMGLSWMDNLTSASSSTTADNLCSSLHIGKSRLSSLNTYYFMTPASLGVTYIPVEVLKPVFVANLDTIVRLNRLGQTSKKADSADARTTLQDAGKCIPTSVWDYNQFNDNYENLDGRNYGLDADNHAVHIASSYDETIVTDGLVEFDLSTIQVKVDYFYHDFSDGSPESALLISKLNGTLTDTGTGLSGENSLRNATLQAFMDQDSSQYVSSFGGASFSNNYEAVGKGRVIARVTAKVKVHVPYKSSILQWASYMFTGTKHYDIKRFDETTGKAFTNVDDSDGIWYQYTTYFCTSRS